MTTTDPSGYAEVSGLRMYYEIHGTGTPLLLLHGAYMTIEMMEPLLAGLAKRRQVIAVELRGHGHTGDAEGPITYEQMADDCAALLGQLDLAPADVVGYSMGGATGIQLAIRHPDVGLVHQRRHARGRPQHVPHHHPRIVRRLAVRGRVPAYRAAPREVPRAGGQAQEARHHRLLMAR